MILIDLKKDIEVPRSEIIVNSESSYNRREFLIYTIGGSLGLCLPSQSFAFSPAIPAAIIAMIAKEVIKGLLKGTIKYSIKEMEKRGVRKISDLAAGWRDKIIDIVTDLLSDYFSKKIERSFVENALIKYNIISNTPEAAWNINSSDNILTISFENQTDSAIKAKLYLKMQDTITKEFDDYMNPYYIELDPKGKASFDVPFADLVQKGLKRIFLIGYGDAEKLNISSNSGKVLIDTIFI